MKKMFVFMLIVLFSFVILNAEQVTLSPVDDMYTDAEHPASSQVSTQLWTADFNPSGMHQRILMKFDFSELREDIEITNAELVLTRFYSCPAGGTTAVNFKAITQEWEEETWNPTQHIQVNESIYMPYVFQGAGGNLNIEFRVNVTNFINDMKNNNLTNGFVIQANPGQKFSKFYSKEHVAEDLRPKLIVTYNVVNNDINTVSNVFLGQNYPNPFYLNNESDRGVTNICFNLKVASNVSLSIYDIRGHLVKEIINSKLEKGEHYHAWNGKNSENINVANGVYFYQLKTENEILTKKMMIVR